MICSPIALSLRRALLTLFLSTRAFKTKGKGKKAQVDDDYDDEIPEVEEESSLLWIIFIEIERGALSIIYYLYRDRDTIILERILK